MMKCAAGVMDELSGDVRVEIDYRDTSRNAYNKVSNVKVRPRSADYISKTVLLPSSHKFCLKGQTGEKLNFDFIISKFVILMEK